MVFPIFRISTGTSSGTLLRAAFGVIFSLHIGAYTPFPDTMSPGAWFCPYRWFLVSISGYKLLRCLSGSPCVFLPEVLSVKEDWRAPFQDTVIDTGMGQVRRVLQFAQLQVRGDDHGPAAAVAAVNDEKHLLHRILGAAFHTQIVNDKQVVLIEAGYKICPVLREHSC